ncbi:MAG: hypothetical protein IKO72_12290 [Kiritimatiellae bacterium]|nr:hypothetical protein [Kiritimatiellia bacterium]
MVSPTAIADIRAALSSGVKLTPEDIIRLNALALRHDYAKAGADLRIMPRLSWLGDVAFREPTIGHEIWMQEVADVFNLGKPETLLKVRAFCLATAPEDLPDPGAGRERLKKAVAEFLRKRLAEYTLGQVAAALVFAETGNDQMAGEIPVAAPARGRKAKKQIREGERCYEVGLLRNGVLLRLGSPDDLRRMTVTELEELITEAMKADKRWGAEFKTELVSEAFGDYKRTLDAIRAERSKGE